MALHKPDYCLHVALDSERLDELEYRIRGICEILGYEVREIMGTEYRVPDDEGNYSRPYIQFQLAQNEKPK